MVSGFKLSPAKGRVTLPLSVDPFQKAQSMTGSKDPTDPIRERAAGFVLVAKGTYCAQSSFKAGKGTSLFIGPGPKGKGFKAMVKLKESMPQALKLAAKEPKRFEVGSTGWVTARFTAGEPLPKEIWEPWLEGSFELTSGK